MRMPNSKSSRAQFNPYTFLSRGCQRSNKNVPPHTPIHHNLFFVCVPARRYLLLCVSIHSIGKQLFGYLALSLDKTFGTLHVEFFAPRPRINT
jgi:hypothetical protein